MHGAVISVVKFPSVSSNAWSGNGVTGRADRSLILSVMAKEKQATKYLLHHHRLQARS